MECALFWIAIDILHEINIQKYWAMTFTEVYQIDSQFEVFRKLLRMCCICWSNDDMNRAHIQDFKGKNGKKTAQASSKWKRVTLSF